MSFSLRLVPDLLPVEAGATTPLSLNISSKGDAPEQVEIQVEGLDPEWIATPEPVFTIEPGEDHVERIFFKPGRVSESLAGNYPFVVRVRSLTSGEAKTVAGILQIKPYNHLSMEISPKKGYYSSYRKINTFTVSVMNLGNTEHNVQLFGSDPEDECAFDFDQETFILAPGQSKSVEVSVTPRSSRAFAGSRLFGFSISARSSSSPGVAAAAQGQLEQRPILSPGVIAFGVVVLVLLLAWFALLPKPPTVTLTVQPMQVTQGDPVHISWDSKDATRVLVKVNGQEEPNDVPSNPQGMDIKTTGAKDTLRIEATPYKDQKVGVTKTQYVTIIPPVVIPDPEITEFAPSDKKAVDLGSSVILRYKFNSAVVRATLSPAQNQLDINAHEIEVVPTHVGPVEYQIIAYNSAGKTDKREVVINVREKIDVTIDSFEVTPTTVANLGDQVTVNWRAGKAAKVQLLINGVGMDVPPDGSRSFPIQGPTQVQLVAADEKGHTVRRSKTVIVQSVPPPDASPTPPTTTGTGPP